MHRGLCFAASFFKGAAVGTDVAIDAATFSLWYDKCVYRFVMHCRNNEFVSKVCSAQFQAECLESHAYKSRKREMRRAETP
jgi:hypothetical protein